MRFSFPHSHAFPGGRVAVAGDDIGERSCEVEFADGVTVIGTCRKEGETYVLDVPTYRTSRGTEVAGRRWRINAGKDGNWRLQRAG